MRFFIFSTENEDLISISIFCKTSDTFINYESQKLFYFYNFKPLIK